MFFRGEHFFLSNFFKSPIEFEYGNHTYVMPTVENAFQGAKVLVSSLGADERRAVLAQVEQASPGESKGIGRSLPLDAKAWDAVAEQMMLTALLRKFVPGSELATRLLATGDMEIVEDNDHGDRVWGRVNGSGTNKLGVLLMQVRADLRAGQGG